MATISRSGITVGGTISPTHITNIIDALDGTGVGITVVATGSFTGSLVGTATTATSASYATTASYVANASSFPYTGSARITGSLILTGSMIVSGSQTFIGTKIISGSVFITGSKTVIGNNTITGSLSVLGSTSIIGNVTISGSATDNINLNTNLLGGSIKARSTLIVNFADIALASAAGKFVIPLNAPTSPTAGTLYWDDNTSTLFIYNENIAGWTHQTFSV
jgi:hypothetical protein